MMLIAFPGTVSAQKRIASYQVTGRGYTENYALSYDSKGRLSSMLATAKGETDTLKSSYTYTADQIEIFTLVKPSKDSIVFKITLDNHHRISTIKGGYQNEHAQERLVQACDYDSKGQLTQTHRNVYSEVTHKLTWSGGNITEYGVVDLPAQAAVYGKENNPAGFDFSKALIISEMHMSPSWPLYLTGGYLGTPTKNLISELQYSDGEGDIFRTDSYKYVMNAEGYPTEIKISKEDSTIHFTFTYE